MSTDQAASRDDYRANLTLTLPLSLLRRLEPYTAKRQRGAFIQAAVERELERLEQQEAAS
jgi:hypothetical protein